MAKENESHALRQRLISAMEGKESHLDFDSAVSDFPVEFAGAKPHGAPHSAWELLEHLRIAQRDILEFSRDPADYKEMEWPDDYWPNSSSPPGEEAWNRSVEAFKSDRAELERMVSDAKRDLFKPFAHGNGQTLIREALVLANHNSYHLGQLVFLKKMLTAK
jgi:DinB superfamily